MTATASQRRRPSAILPAFLIRGMVFLILWWLLTGGATGSWIIGVPAALAATVLSLAIAPLRTAGPRLARLPGFALYFLRESVVGGVDVAARALHPAMPLRPGFITVSMSRLGRPQRLLYAVLVSLMPGTLAARLEGETLRVHVLDTALPLAHGLDRLQDRVAELFGHGEART